MQKIRLLLTGVCLILFVMNSHAQYFQFSQYNFTKQRINPATVGLSDYASASLDYRRQSTGGDFSINSNFLDLSYPFFTKKKVRWSGIGISFMDDRSGESASFKTQEIAVAYSGNVWIAKNQILSLGTKVLYQIRKLDLDALYTGSQYIPDRGFDQSVFNGEPGSLQSNYLSLNLGMHWQLNDKKNERRAYAGLSFFDFNKPQEDFIIGSQLNETWVAATGVRVYQGKQVSLTPELLFTQSAKASWTNIGVVTQYDLERIGKFRDHLKILTKYVVGRSAVAGIQLHKENFSIGFSYDFPVTKNDMANQGAFEIGIEIRKLIQRSRVPSTQSSRPAATPTPSRRKPVKPDTTIQTPDPVVPDPPKNEMSERLKHKQDSVNALARAGVVKHEPLILETATVHFNFEFNSAEPDEGSLEYLDNLAEALRDNLKLKIKITGHTDNVGSDKFNLKLSQYRANAIRDFLIENGVETERVMSDGKGMREPLNNNKTEADRALNRRVELTILYED